MIVAILSDIHGNTNALVPVLKEAKAFGVEKLLILGDLVGYYYDAKGVFKLLAGWDKTIVKGNHEKMLLDLHLKIIDPSVLRAKYGSGVEIALKELSLETLNEIFAYEEKVIVRLDGVSIQLCHGSPWSMDQYIYPDSDPSLLAKCESPDIDFVFLGHTHYPFTYHGRSTTIINPGSVGQSRVKGGMANWGILNTSSLVYISKQTFFDVAPVIDLARTNDPEVEHLQAVLRR